jgi:hypothetical protein
MPERGISDHGSCVVCGFDLNGDWIYEYFLREYGDEKKALDTAKMYGATKTEGRFGKELYVKEYDEDYNKLPSYFKCPTCGGRCYDL